ncbi:hypothetical protein RFI_31742 [Reticulomyxa filosa]|uniref:Uncharacterized protein n=1 Tax=Reticulomyxa filosa TaxID=46433 RepID=X6LW96_RETFI|nr:hypothetical protein RFI_31742 [Reticulomyxa filosa]|eukprot:ETO05656.1 hypothetical protein RFI_31742 [Reticulomyxa filosa]
MKRDNERATKKKNGVISWKRSGKNLLLRLTLKELRLQIYDLLQSDDYEEISKMKMDAMDMKGHVIESNEDVRKDEEKKLVKNALVMVIAISEYDKMTNWPNLKNMKEKDLILCGHGDNDNAFGDQ